MDEHGVRGFGSLHTYTRLAPSVDQTWIERFVLEQRLLGVSGRRIGDSLALVESHVAESGESAQAAFGDPRSYAKDDAPDHPERPSERIDRGWAVGIVLGLAGMLSSTFGAQAAFSGAATLDVTAGLIVVLAIVAAALALVLIAPLAFARVLTALPMRGWVGWMLLLGAMVGALLLLRQSVVALDVLAAMTIGAVLIVIGFVLQLRAYLGGQVQDDPIVGPGEHPTASRSGLAAVLILPVATIVMIGFSWLLAQIPELL